MSPVLVPTASAVDKAARALAGPEPQFHERGRYEQYAYRQAALDMFNAAGPELVTSVLAHVVEHSADYQLNPIDRLGVERALEAIADAQLAASDITPEMFGL